MFQLATIEKLISNKSIMMAIVLGMILLMVMALIIDGEMGERCFATLLGSFGLILGYFFRKAQVK